MLSDVQKFYSGKTIFITGATGFLGQILLSKLLCSCQEIRCFYILIRETAGKSVQIRMKEVFDDPVFVSVKEQHPNFETKIKFIRGDCSKKDMGISYFDRAIIENEVDIIFNVAATVQFTVPFRESTYTNIRSVDILLDIAKNMKNLKCFMHVSTAYSPCAKTELIEEKFYDPPMKAQNLISLVENLDDKVLDEISPKLSDLYPNWYIYAKLVAEDLCREKGSTLPLCIFRPAGVISCYKEPIPGWTNNIYGCMGIIFGHALGIVKVAPVDENCSAPVVPGDYCINALIVSAYHTSLSWQGKTVKLDQPIINCSDCYTKNGFTWGSLVTHYSPSLEKYPFYNTISPPYLKFFKNYTIYRCLAVFLHLIPAVIFDLVLIATGKNPRFKKIYRKTHEYIDLVKPFSLKGWTIISNNIGEVCSTLSDKDKELFYCDLNKLNIEDYFDTMIRGMRLYLAKDSEDTLQMAVEKRRKFRILYSSIISIIVLVFLYFLKCSFGFIYF